MGSLSISKTGFNSMLPETPANLRKRENPVEKPIVQQASETAPVESQPESRLYVVNLPARHGFTLNSTTPASIPIQFQKISYVEKTTVTLCISNPSTSRVNFSIQMISKPKVESAQRFGFKAQMKHTIEGEIFKFESMQGSLEPSDQRFMTLTFKPLIAGIYTQSFLVRCHGKGITLNLSGEGSSQRVENSAPSLAPKKQHEFAKAMRRATNKPYNPVLRKRVPISAQQASRQVSASQQKVLVFDDLLIGRTQTLELRIENPKRHECVFDVFVSAPFAVPTKKLNVPAESYTSLPVAFRPTRPGSSSSFIVVKVGSDVLKVKLMGSAHLRR